MAKQLILKSQANAVFHAIQKAGLSPSEFYWKEVTSRWSNDIVSQLCHASSGYYFIFDLSSDRRFPWAIYRPSADFSTEYSEIMESWEKQVLMLQIWLVVVKRETEIPDLWAAMSQEKQLAEAAAQTDIENTEFSAQEQKLIASSLHEIKEHLFSTQSFTEDQKEFIDSRIHYLEEASQRMGRKDWINLALGVITSIVISVVLPPNAARELLRVVSNVFSWLINSQPLLP